MKKITYIALFALLMSVLPIQKTFALSCVQPPKPEVAIHDYDVVVIATVTETDSNSPYKTIKTVKADVSHVFKGLNDSTITFTEDKFWGASQVGREYLLFLNSKDKGFESPLCSPTTLTAGLDIETLIEKLTPEETSTSTETIVTTPPVSESVKTDESNNSESSLKWPLLISISIILILLAVVIGSRRGKVKRIGGN